MVKIQLNEQGTFPSNEKVSVLKLPALLTTETEGAYALVIHMKRYCDLSIGRLGICSFVPGYYIYLGSALGSGGVQARVQRHLRYAKTKLAHWHIDNLLAAGKIVEVWWKPGKERMECLWAAMLRNVGSIHVPGFGASDCRCPGHLVRFEDRKSVSSGFHLLGSNLHRQRVVQARALSPAE